MAYTLRLIRLECIQAQEFDGDEAYLTLDGRQIWAAGRVKMNQTLSRPHQCSEVDFASGQLLMAEGWVPMPSSADESFTFSGLEGETILRLWDSDRLTSDDLLGETPIAERDSGRGHISVLFTRDGARYRLTYEVEA